MRYEDSPVKAPPPSRRKMTPWRQNSSSSSIERQWHVGLKEQRVAWRSSERKAMRAVENHLESSADIQVDVEVPGAPGAFDRARRRRGLSEVHPEVLDKKRKAIFSSFLTQARKRTISWRAEGVGWSTKERG